MTPSVDFSSLSKEDKERYYLTLELANIREELLINRLMLAELLSKVSDEAVDSILDKFVPPDKMKLAALHKKIRSSYNGYTYLTDEPR